ncbi:MAG: trimeric intracellular cation channel family protein [Flammeovirgaceae bacterium]
MDIIYALDLIGTFVFAISGTLTAAEKKFDIFGAFVIAFVTAVGGGTIRDVLIGSQPVGWMTDLNYIYLIGLTVPISFFFKKYILKLRKTMFLFDTIGIGLFTILGFQKTMDLALSPIVGVMMGTVSAVFGGVVRDTLCNEVPLIFRKEIYAMACVLGASLFFWLDQFVPYHNLNISLTVGCIIVVRVLAVKRNWTLPVIR